MVAGAGVTNSELTPDSAPRAETILLKLHTGSTVRARVQVGAGNSRPKCLFLHGNPGSLDDWGAILSRLSSTGDVDDAVAAADALAWNEPVVLVGHSHGGGVAQTAAVRHPQRIAGVVLVATLGAPAHASYRLLSAPGAAAGARLAGAIFKSRALRPVAKRILRGVMKDIFSPEQVPSSKVEAELALFAARPEIVLSMVHVALGQPCQQLSASAPDIECPVLFVHGRDDALVPVSHAKAIHERLIGAGRRSEFLVLPDSGHMLIEFQAAAVADAIARFLPA
jgi:pimeloyl-ACP methyl ester carboxylesterase